MKKTWNDEKIIKFMEKETGILNGFISRDDDGLPIAYADCKDNGPVFAFLFEDNSNDMDYMEL